MSLQVTALAKPKSKHTPTQHRIYFLSSDRLSLLTISRINSHCQKHASPFIFVCALLCKHTHFNFSSAFERQLGGFQRQPKPAGPAVQSLLRSLGRQVAGSCLCAQTTQGGDDFHLFPSACGPLLPLGRCCGCQPVQLVCLLQDIHAAAHGLSIASRGRGRGAESGSQ